MQDLLKPFQNESIDIVAGIDAMGFILGKTGGETKWRHRGSFWQGVYSYRGFYFELQLILGCRKKFNPLGDPLNLETH